MLRLKHMKLMDGFLLCERSDFINHTEEDWAGGVPQRAAWVWRDRDGDRDSAATVRKQIVCAAAFSHVPLGHDPVQNLVVSLQRYSSSTLSLSFLGPKSLRSSSQMCHTGQSCSFDIISLIKITVWTPGLCLSSLVEPVPPHRSWRLILHFNLSLLLHYRRINKSVFLK